MSRKPQVFASLVAGALCVHQSLGAQTPSASPPAACLASATAWRTAQVAPALAAYRKATDANRTELQRQFIAANDSATNGSQKMASVCAAQLDTKRLPAAELLELVTLYTFARDTTNARVITERLVMEPSLPPRLRGQTMLLSLNSELERFGSTFAIIESAERIARQIDQLPDSLNDIKLRAHQSMLGRYEYLDVAEGLFVHATAVIALARAMHQPAMMISGFSSLSRSFADRLMPDSALRILDAGEKEIGAAATKQFADFRHRYALIGTQAPRIEAKWWINTDRESVATPAPGVVTLIEFTAHWCGPCKNSYPGLRLLTDRFKGKAFTGVMVTQLYGYLGTQRNLSPAQEVAADREYFGKEHAVPFPVAINPQMAQTGGAYLQPKPDTDYRVGGIPQIMIVDKRGVIRQIVTGWDQGNTERFSRLIEQLLNEKP